ncbi:hypothetical protein KHP62_08680 [Rhodobacteraceae bacterium NNCM2]|nr:hypothetical protein [Coraliihabitans acroporae]
MMNIETWPLFVIVPVSLVAGVLLGSLYFRAVRLCAELLVTGRAPLVAIALTIGRFAVMVGCFLIAVQAGAVAVLALLGGVMLGRKYAMREARA